jgi:hypothetical protein
MASAAAFHAIAPVRVPKTPPFKRNNKTQNDVVKPAIAMCECATSPLVNFNPSNAPGKNIAKPEKTKTIHHSITATRQAPDCAGHANRRQSRQTSHGHGKRSPRAPICSRSL